MSKTSDKVVYESHERIVAEDGQVKSTLSKKTVAKASEPNYIKLYLDTLLAFKELPRTLNPLLVELLSCMSYANQSDENGGQIVVINSYIKSRISEKLDIKTNTIDKSLTVLCNSKIFRRVGRGTYQVNPCMFGKGEWSDISAIRATFNFNTGDVKATIEKAEQNNKDEMEGQQCLQTP